MAASKLTFEERFWSKVRKTDTCWLWTGCRDGFGYGMFAIRRGVARRAHRIAWELTHGPIRPTKRKFDTLVLHKCDNPPCVNPDHLFFGTQEDNVRDRDQKHRQDGVHGEQHWCSKLTADDVRRIRADRRINKLIASEYGVTREHIGAIKRRVNWKHVD